MDHEIRKRIPKQPDWRWALHHKLNGEDHDSVTEGVRLLARYLEDNYDNPREAAGLTSIDDEGLHQAIRLRDTPPISQLIEHMLVESCEIEWIEEAIYYKFNETVSTEVIDLYRRLFWDTKALNNYDLRKFYQDRSPAPPPVQGDMRSAYMAYQAGVQVDIDHDKIAQDILLQSFFRSKELSQFGVPADDSVIDYQKLALKAYKALQESDIATDEGLPTVFDRPIKYAENSAIDAEELEGYDPDEDSGYEEVEDE